MPSTIAQLRFAASDCAAQLQEQGGGAAVCPHLGPRSAHVHLHLRLPSGWRHCQNHRRRQPQGVLEAGLIIMIMMGVAMVLLIEESGYIMLPVEYISKYLIDHTCL